MLLGAQSFTIRAFTQNKADFRIAMQKVADIGYRCVQLSAIGAMEPQFLRDTCDEAGLQIVLTHTNPDRMLNDTAAVIREHQALGCRYVGMGMMNDRYRCADWIDRFAQDWRRPAEMLRDAGMRLMYHNHNFEWERLSDGRRIIDVLLEQMPAELMGITLDTYWVQAAGADLMDWIDRLQDRIPCVHLKDMAVQGFQQRMAAVGEGNINFPKVLRRLEELGKTEYMLVEQDDCYGESPFACLKRSYDYVTGLGY